MARDSIPMRRSSLPAKETVRTGPKLGAAWPHDDRKGFNVELIALPVSGRLVIRERKPASA